MARVLYISYDGMTDALGASQVLPYLEGLSARGHSITLLSCEKPRVFKKGRTRVIDRCKAAGIEWRPVPYHKRPPVMSTMKDVRRLKREALIMHLKQPFDIVHCRSYISALAGLQLKKKYQVPFIFDMRGFWADERIDGGLWSKSHPVFGKVYRYFKKKERQFFNHADHVVSLTKAGKDEFMTWGLKLKEEDISIIPTCADVNHFSRANADETQTKAFREELNIPEDAFVLTYLGSVGTWYMPDEMMQFFARLKQQKPEAIFLWVTRDHPNQIKALAAKHDIPETDIRIKASGRDELPSLLALSDLSVFFIKPLFSKKASSPTKLAELWSMNIPVICNGGVGDLNDHIKPEHGGWLVNGFEDADFDEAIAQIPALQATSEADKKAIVLEHYTLEKGTECYHKIYQKLTSS